MTRQWTTPCCSCELTFVKKRKREREREKKKNPTYKPLSQSPCLSLPPLFVDSRENKPKAKSKEEEKNNTKKMLRVAGRRLSSLPWRCSQTTSAFVSQNSPFLSDGRDSAASSRSILSPYHLSFTPDLIRGHLFLSSDLDLASSCFWFLALDSVLFYY
jgi:hypothetical protein